MHVVHEEFRASRVPLKFRVRLEAKRVGVGVKHRLNIPAVFVSGGPMEAGKVKWHGEYRMVDLIDAMMKIHQYAILCAPTPSQEAATEALKEADAITEEARNTYRLRRDFLRRRLQEAGLPSVRPDGAFYLFVDIQGTGLSGFDVAKKLLDEVHVAVIPCEPFGSPHHIRMSYATSEKDIEAAVTRISSIFK